MANLSQLSSTGYPRSPSLDASTNVRHRLAAPRPFRGSITPCIGRIVPGTRLEQPDPLFVRSVSNPTFRRGAVPARVLAR